MLGLLLALLVDSILPQVESPWPDRIGIEWVLYLAGLGGAAGGLLTTWSSPERRDRFARFGLFGGFVLGASIYVTALVNQLLST